MKDFEEELNRHKTKEELEDLKHQLFMENVRIQTEKGQLENDLEDIRRQKKQIAMERRQLQREKKQLSLEMNELRQQVEYQRKRLKEDEKSLSSRQDFLENSYFELHHDKQLLQEQLRRVELEKEKLLRLSEEAANRKKASYTEGIFFRGVNNNMALKKRYKDLLKIYHPDNMCGDKEILLHINREYEELRNRFE